MGFPSSIVRKTSVCIFAGDNHSAFHPLFVHVAKPRTGHSATIAATPYAHTLTTRRASVTNLARPSLPRRPPLNGTRGHTLHRRLIIRRPIGDGATGFNPPGDVAKSTTTSGNLLRSFILLEDQVNLEDARPTTTIAQSGVESANFNQHRRRWRTAMLLNPTPRTPKASSS